MKASELIYRLAKGIEAKGDKDMRLAVVKTDSILSADVEADVSNVDFHDDYFEIYGEEK